MFLPTLHADTPYRTGQSGRQHTATGNAESYISQRKRIYIAMQKDAYCSTKGCLLQCKRCASGRCMKTDYFS